MSDVRTILSNEVVAVSPDDTVAEAARHMADRELGLVLVREGATVVGVFSERDLAVKVVAAGRDPNRTKVGEVATREMKAVSLDTPIVEVARDLGWKHLRHLIVLDGEEAAGVVAMRDVLAALVEKIQPTG